jgi:nucleotide-binding universal stress UspA family protein
MKTVLIPTDFSNAARNALKYAVSLFGEDNRFILLNTYNEPTTGTASMISLRDILQEASEDSLKEELTHIKEEMGLSHINLDSRSVYGIAYEEIAHISKQESVDVVVMGTTGASGMKEVFIGSVASAVLQKSVCPIITVPSNYTYSKLTNILFATDLKNSALQSLPNAFDWVVKKDNAKVTVLTVQSYAAQSEGVKPTISKALNDLLNTYDHQFKYVGNDNIEDGISEFAHQNEMDMIITIPRKESWFTRLFHPSVSKKLAQHLDMPLLALHSV